MRKIIWICCLCLASPAFAASWTLQADEASLSFLSVKKGAIVEAHHFSQVSGQIDEHGMAHVSIDLASVQTGIAKRDDRLRRLLFDIAHFPKAELSLNVASLLDAAVGTVHDQHVAVRLRLHGEEKLLDVYLRVAVLSEHRLLVTALTPVMLKAKDFKLDEGIEALRSIAHLASIAHTVPVMFQLLFER